MDLVLMILRFLFGMPDAADQLEPILVHADGSTSNGRTWLATQRGIRNSDEVSTHRPRFLYSKPNSLSGFWERFCISRVEARCVPRTQECGRRSRA